MKLIDYTGKLNAHEKYIEIINKLEKITKYIEIVIIDENCSSNLVNKFKKNIISIKSVSKWWGTESGTYTNLYRLEVSKEIFDELRTYETFCKCYYCKCEFTDFGIDDIAFYNEKNEYLLYTTTHEMYITINEDLLK